MFKFKLWFRRSVVLSWGVGDGRVGGISKYFNLHFLLEDDIHNRVSSELFKLMAIDASSLVFFPEPYTEHESYGSDQ